MNGFITTTGLNWVVWMYADLGGYALDRVVYRYSKIRCIKQVDKDEIAVVNV